MSVGDAVGGVIGGTVGNADAPVVGCCWQGWLTPMVWCSSLLLVAVREVELCCWCLQCRRLGGVELVIRGGVNGLTGDIGWARGSYGIYKWHRCYRCYCEIAGVELVLFIVTEWSCSYLVILVPAVFLAECTLLTVVMLT